MPTRDSEPTPLPPGPPSGARVKISRRSFGRRAAGVAAFSLSPATLLASPVSGQESEAQGQTTGNKNPGIAPESVQEVEAKLANIVRKYGMRLSDAQRQHLRRILVYNERMLASVRSFSLQNGDPPASVLKLVAGDRAGPEAAAAASAKRDGFDEGGERKV